MIAMFRKRSPNKPKKPDFGWVNLAPIGIAFLIVIIGFVMARGDSRTIPAKHSLSDLMTASESEFPAGNYEVANGALIATFSSNRKFSVKRPSGDLMAEGTYEIDQDQIVLSETSDGEDGNRMCEGPGKYKWKFDGKALSFSKIEDDCEGRSRALTSGPCPIIRPR